jgi:hypothetical protein
LPIDLQGGNLGEKGPQKCHLLTSSSPMPAC